MYPPNLLRSNLDSQVADDEPLTRFIFQSSHWRSTKNKVKGAAFMPPPANLKTSVSRVGSLTNGEIWSIGVTVGGKRGPPKARGDVIEQRVLQVGLDVEPAPTPDNPRHANIVGWPTEKDEQKLLALELARFASLSFPEK